MQRQQLAQGAELPASLLVSLVSFLDDELEGELLSQPARERQRNLLSQLRQVCSTADRSGHSSCSASPRAGGNKARLSLPQQLFDLAGCSQGSDGSEHSIHSLEDYETPGQFVAESIPLPTRRRVSAGARRMSALPEQQQQQQQQLLLHRQQPLRHPSQSSVSIVGPLWYRRRSCRWQRLGNCSLQPTGLQCHKSRHVGPQQQPTLSLQLAGYTVVYVRRESQADHVIKLAHPSLPTYALAADTEEQARTWVRHLAAHAAGLPAPAFCSFLTPSQPPAAGQATATTAAFLAADFEPTDSGFSGPVSSSSNDDSCEPAPDPAEFNCVQLRQASLAKSASFSPGVEPPVKPSSSAASGLIRRFRESFSQGAAAIVRRRRSKLADDEAAAAAAAAATAAAATAAAASMASAAARPDPNVLLSALAELRINQESVWRRRLLQLGVDGRLYFAELGASAIPNCVQLDGLRLGPNTTPGHCGFQLATPTVPERTVLEVRGLGKLEIGAWIKQLSLATGLASTYEPPAELLDLPSARAAALRQRLLEGSSANGRRASMPAVAMTEQLVHQQLIERQHSMLWRPLPPTPPEAARQAAQAAAQRRGSLLLPYKQPARYW